MGVVEVPLAARLHGLTYLERSVLGLLIEHANDQKGDTATLGQVGIAKQLGAARSKVFDAYKSLLKQGYIEARPRPGKSSITTVIYPAIIADLQRAGLWESVPKMTRKKFETLPRAPD